ncbi:GA-binding protein subunit beta-1-like [Mya arenaria]|uniref:GA-binding protein subunit beta-1-like n=1 Tax=Mya arenaria TaxID=6604 RepID=UPI0022E757F9|nr:GA-binding protein subunit beta-1-like [Mya arenaria]XP_052800138.1 GA-binding protein subunit beta-1-like [Mya arenaria]
MSYCLLDNESAQLCMAIRMGTISDIQALVDAGVAVNSADQNGETALHVAAWVGEQTMTQELLDSGAETNVQNQNGQTPLHIAAGRGHDTVVHCLLRDGCDVNTKTKYTEMTALHLASQNGHTQVVRLLLQYGADVDTQDVVYKTADFYAADAEIAQLLGKHRAMLEEQRQAIEAEKIAALNAAEHNKAMLKDKKMKYSKDHRKIMKKNVFDRLTRTKSQLLKD